MPIDASPPGWRKSLACCTAATATTTLTSLICLAIAAPKLKPFTQSLPDGTEVSFDGALFNGKCETAQEFNTWLHLLINILSTALLASGNYAQQMLTAPTREEVDVAHEKKEWLDIGILSWRNLGSISKKRRAIWAVLVLSSLPVHLMFNGVIYLERNVNLYKVWTIDEATASNASATLPDGQRISDFTRLGNKECIEAYGRVFVLDHLDVALVLDTLIGDDMQVVPSIQEPTTSSYSWMCASFRRSGPTFIDSKPDDEFGKELKITPCDIKVLAQRAREWDVEYRAESYFGGKYDAKTPVKYCMSRKTEQACRTALNVPLLGVVVACCIIKLAGMIITWFLLERRPLLRVGDAVASFLDRPDSVTYNCHLLQKSPMLSRIDWSTDKKAWRSKKRAGSFFISVWSLIGTVLVVLAATGLTLSLLGIAAKRIKYPLKLDYGDLFARGFRGPDVELLLGSSRTTSGDLAYHNSIVVTSVLANLPQLAASLLYTSINYMWTAVMVGVEWNRMGKYRRSLRTTSPIGEQRSSYWLSLPFKIMIPLLVASTLFHWFISQTLYFVRIAINDQKGLRDVITAPGFSPLGAFISQIGAGIALAFLGVATSITIQPAIPQAGTCSLVVSAACHPPMADINASLMKVQWGEVRGEDGEPRCCVTSHEVQTPEEGKEY